MLRPAVRPGSAALGPSLTAREVEVLRGVALGLDNARIAARLGTSLGGVKGQLHRAKAALSARTRLEAVSAARAVGQLP
ncbi:helix-turn-helix transcriptional regulator [Pseudonocardia sp. NPDC049154]|uniref:helix-turn-helix domain-containing protein n=1 Tax=Pseudonocardia sp. NPDC049154 TaxID=3155501 RepID=UPI0033C5BFBE